MQDLFSLIYVQYLDYFLFFFGLFFFGIGFMLFFLKRQRNIWRKGHPIKVIIFYFIMMGIVSWLDFFSYLYNDFSSFSSIHYYIYLLAYLLLFETGRRLLFFNKRVSLLLYIIPLLIILMNNSSDITSMFITFLSSTMVGIGFFIWVKEGKVFSNITTLAGKLLYIPFFILSSGYFLILILYILVGDSFHLFRHFLEWSIQLFFGCVFMYHILNIRIRAQIDYQLRDSLVKVAKRTLILVIIVFIIGFNLVAGFGRLAWTNDRNNIQITEEVLANSIIDDAIALLEASSENDIDFNYTNLKKDLISMKENKKRIQNISIFYCKNGDFIYGLDTITVIDRDKKNFGEVYSNPPLLMLKACIDKTTTFEERFTDSVSGEYLSSYQPVINEQGIVIAIMKIDITGESILDAIFNYRFIAISITFAIMLFIFVLALIQYFYLREKVWLVNYQNILTSISELVCIVDEEGNIFYTNEAMSKITGYSHDGKSEENTKKLKDILGLELELTSCKSLLQKAKQKESFYDEITILDVNGNSIPLFISIQVLGEVTDSSLFVFVGMNITEQKKRIRDMQAYFENTLALLATAIDAKDKYTRMHSSNVAKYAKGIAKEMKLPEALLKEIERGALLHDIGKIYISDDILKKEGLLSDEEWEIMKKHSEYGKGILEKAGKTMEKLIPYIYYHHERYDGKGYPTQMIKPSIEISIVTLADAFEAMSSDRSYRERKTIEFIKADIIKNSGTQFHPKVVEGFLKYVEGIENIEELE